MNRSGWRGNCRRRGGLPAGPGRAGIRRSGLCWGERRAALVTESRPFDIILTAGGTLHGLLPSIKRCTHVRKTSRYAEWQRNCRDLLTASLTPSSGIQPQTGRCQTDQAAQVRSNCAANSQDFVWIEFRLTRCYPLMVAAYAWPARSTRSKRSPVWLPRCRAMAAMTDPHRARFPSDLAQPARSSLPTTPQVGRQQ